MLRFSCMICQTSTLVLLFLLLQVCGLNIQLYSSIAHWRYRPMAAIWAHSWISQLLWLDLSACNRGKVSTRTQLTFELIYSELCLDRRSSGGRSDRTVTICGDTNCMKRTILQKTSHSNWHTKKGIFTFLLKGRGIYNLNMTGREGCIAISLWAVSHTWDMGTYCIAWCSWERLKK